MDHSDLPLFSWRPQGQIILFPMHAQHGHVARMAATLLHKQGAEANLYWKQVIASNRAHLIRLGLSVSEQDEQLQQLFDAVQEALAWAAINRHESSP